jgi:hypothetical protein
MGHSPLEEPYTTPASPGAAQDNGRLACLGGTTQWRSERRFSGSGSRAPGLRGARDALASTAPGSVPTIAADDVQIASALWRCSVVRRTELGMHAMQIEAGLLQRASIPPVGLGKALD